MTCLMENPNQKNFIISTRHQVGVFFYDELSTQVQLFTHEDF